MIKIFFSVVVFLLSVQVSLAQLHAAKADFWVERIPVKGTAEYSCSRQEVTLVSGKDMFGLMSSTDTLAMYSKPKINKFIYRNELNQDFYIVSAIKAPTGFLIFITPIVDKAPHATHSLVITTTNICNARKN